MKKILTLLLVGIFVTGCRTNENNYRSAYEIAKQKKEKSEENIPGGSRLYKYDLPKETVIEGDTLQALRTYAGIVEGGNITREEMKKYNVVVGQFKQLFNARQMMSRIKDNGYVDAGVLVTRQNDFLVISNQLSTPGDALSAIRKVEADSMLKLREPLPFVLIPNGVR